MIQLLGGILFGVGVVGLVAWLQAQLLITMYRRGYERGRKDAAEWWLGVGQEVEEMRKELRYEEEA